MHLFVFAMENGSKEVEDIDEGAINIFLFSNGQQYSPPRKYHLKPEELTWWETTLGHLARSQYGSLHSGIDLYTIDGSKVESPGDLRNYAVYVAVVPPDPFIYAGYDKYLVKASRSWEKRQSKRNSNIDLKSPADIPITKPEPILEEITNEDTVKDKNMNENSQLEASLTNKTERERSQKRSLVNSRRINDLRKLSTNKTTLNQPNQRPNVPRKVSYTKPPEISVQKMSIMKREDSKGNGTFKTQRTSGKISNNSFNTDIKRLSYQYVKHKVDDRNDALLSKPTLIPIPSKLKDKLDSVPKELDIEESTKTNVNGIDSVKTKDKLINNDIPADKVITVDNLVSTNYSKPEVCAVNNKTYSNLSSKTSLKDQLNVPITDNQNVENKVKSVINDLKSGNMYPQVIQTKTEKHSLQAITKLTNIKKIDCETTDPETIGSLKNSTVYIEGKEAKKENNGDLIFKSSSGGSVSKPFLTTSESDLPNVADNKKILSVSLTNKLQTKNAQNDNIGNTTSTVPNITYPPVQNSKNYKSSISPENGKLSEITITTETIKNIYKNTKSEEDSSISSAIASDFKNNDNDKENLTIPLTFVFKTLSSTNPNIKNDIEVEKNKFVVFVNKGDVINMKMRIEVRNAEGILKKTQNIDVPRRRSRSLSKPKKDGKTNIVEMLTQSKSLQSIANERPPPLCCQKDQKMIVVQCACCDRCSREDTNKKVDLKAAANVDMQQCYVLVPVAPPPTKSCKVSSNTDISEKQVQNTASLTTVSMMTSVKETVTAVPSHNNGASAPNTSQILSFGVQSNEKYESTTNRQVSIVGGQNVRSDLVIVKNPPSQTSAPFTSGNQSTNYTMSNNKSKECNCQDILTQTDWCNVLLEAKLQPDGHYTFHLPSLETLQRYKF